MKNKITLWMPIAFIGLYSIFLTPVFATPFQGILVGDQGLDRISLARDLNNDGDANDSGEVSIYFDASNNSGLASPTDNVFTIHQARSGFQYYGDGNTDTVYRLADLNNDGDALDAGEANVWFSANNASGLPLLAPNGLAEGGDGAIYIVEADVVSTQNGDFVYRTVDLNNDGDANDINEASVWLDLKALNPSSSPFEITFVNDTAYISDTVGRDTDVIYRAQDEDNSGVVESDEVNVFIDENNLFNVPVDFAIDANSDGLYAWEFFDRSGLQSVFRLNDLNLNNMIDEAAEVSEVWNTSALPSGFTTLAGFSMAAGPGNELMLTSNGGSANQDNIIRLVDLNNDGDYLDSGETIIFASRSVNGAFPDRPRALAYLSASAVPVPSTLLLMLLGLLLIKPSHNSYFKFRFWPAKQSSLVTP